MCSLSTFLIAVLISEFPSPAIPPGVHGTEAAPARCRETAGPATQNRMIFGQDTTAPEKILARTAQALGGTEALKSVHSLSLTSAETIMGTTVSSEAKIVYPDKYWTRFETSGGSVTMAVSGLTGWLSTPSGGRVTMPDTQLKGIQASLKRDIITIFAHEAAQKPRYNGLRSIEGTECHDIIFSPGCSAGFHLLVNTKTFLPVALIYADNAAGSTDGTIELLADYKAFGSILLPSRSLVTSEGRLVSQSTIIKITINPDIDASLFK